MTPKDHWLAAERLQKAAESPGVNWDVAMLAAALAVSHAIQGCAPARRAHHTVQHLHQPPNPTNPMEKWLFGTDQEKEKE